MTNFDDNKGLSIQELEDRQELAAAAGDRCIIYAAE